MRNLQGAFTKLSLFTRLSTLSVASIATLGLSGCLLAGYSSGGGWFIWPGSLGFLVVVLVIIILMRRR